MERLSVARTAAPESALDERVTNTLHRVQDFLQQTTVLSQRRSRKDAYQASRNDLRRHAASAALWHAQGRKKQNGSTTKNYPTYLGGAHKRLIRLSVCVSVGSLPPTLEITILLKSQ